MMVTVVDGNIPTSDARNLVGDLSTMTPAPIAKTAVLGARRSAQ